MEFINYNSQGQWNLFNKSNYGPKGAGLYDSSVNASRKIKNVDIVEGIGPNRSVKQYTSAGLSSKQQANKESSSYNKINRKQPVKHYSPAELEQYKQSKLKIAKNGQWSLL